MNVINEDINHMGTALALAKRGLGMVAPNPSVGCVIVTNDGQVVGRGWTQVGGRPHAENEAIRRAGTQCNGATAYVTLEPCSHEGKTPACSKSLINAKIKRVVVACTDPDPRVSGNGIKDLKTEGIEVVQGVLEEEAKQLNLGFFKRLSEGRPLITLKTATTLDGKIATHIGHSKWITGPEARALGHMFRARNDAIIIGIGTALADKPELTCRIKGMESYSPCRIIIDSTLKLPFSNPLVKTANKVPTIVLTTNKVNKEKVSTFRKRGVKVIELAPSYSEHIAPELIAKTLGTEGFNNVLIEGGSKLAGSFIAAGLVDRLAWFHAPKIIGGDGINSIAEFGVEDLLEAQSFKRITHKECGKDIYEVYERTNEK